MRPRLLRSGMAIIVVSLGVTLISFLMTAGRYSSYLPFFYYLETFVFLGLWAALLAFAWQRHGWARVAMIAMLVWTVGNLGWAMMLQSSRGGILFTSFATPVLTLLLRCAGVAMLFTPPANEWFSVRTKS